MTGSLRLSIPNSLREPRPSNVTSAPGDVEIGITDSIQKHFARKVVQRKPISQQRLKYEQKRPKWLRECLAEATGVFIIVYAAIASSAALNFAIANDINTPSVKDAALIATAGSVLQSGFAMAIAVICAIQVIRGNLAHSTITGCLCSNLWRSLQSFCNYLLWVLLVAVNLCACGKVVSTIFHTVHQAVRVYLLAPVPYYKALYYIPSQIIGAFLASIVLFAQYHEQLSYITESSIAAGLGTVYKGGPASIFVSLPATDQNPLELGFVGFCVDGFSAFVTWAIIDPANPFISATTAPFAIGLANAAMLWGFSTITISSNVARDLGTRCFAAIYFGPEVFSTRNLSYISFVVNPIATLAATSYYELVFKDSWQILGTETVLHEHGDEGLQRHWTSNLEMGMADTAGPDEHSRRRRRFSSRK